jgi:hypothetical protein
MLASILALSAFQPSSKLQRAQAKANSVAYMQRSELRQRQLNKTRLIVVSHGSGNDRADRLFVGG